MKQQIRQSQTPLRNNFRKSNGLSYIILDNSQDSDNTSKPSKFSFKIKIKTNDITLPRVIQRLSSSLKPRPIKSQKLNIAESLQVIVEPTLTLNKTILMEEDKIHRHKYNNGSYQHNSVKHSNHGHDSPNKHHSTHGDSTTLHLHQSNLGNDSTIKHHSHHINTPSINLHSTTSKFIDQANMQNIFRIIYEKAYNHNGHHIHNGHNDHEHKNNSLSYIKLYRAQLRNYLLERFNSRITDSILKYLPINLFQLKYEDYEQFVKTLSNLSSDQILHFIYRIYDADGDEVLGQSDLYLLLKEPNQSIQQDMLVILKCSKQSYASQVNFTTQLNLSNNEVPHYVMHSPKKQKVKRLMRKYCVIPFLKLPETDSDDIITSMKEESQEQQKIYIDFYYFKFQYPKLPQLYHEIIDYLGIKKN